MKKYLLIFTAIFALANDKIPDEFKIYEQILTLLKDEDIALFAEQIAKTALPYKIDEAVTLNSVKADGMTIKAGFNVAQSISNASDKDVLRAEFYKNGKREICAENIAVAVLNRGVKLLGVYETNGKYLFDISMDKSSCE